MPNIYNQSAFKLIGKVLLSAALYGIAVGLTSRLWR